MRGRAIRKKRKQGCPGEVGSGGAPAPVQRPAPGRAWMGGQEAALGFGWGVLHLVFPFDELLSSCASLDLAFT